MPTFDGSDPDAVRAAAARLAAGGIVAFPTETVYGLGARADDDAAVAGIFAAKGRPVDHPLIVHVTGETAALCFSPSFPPSAQRLRAAFWPGPLTLIVPRRAGVGGAAAGGQGSIGLRMPSHPVAMALLREAQALGVAGVAAPSANRYGRVSPTTAAHVVDEFGPEAWVLDGGACSLGIESAIVDCTRDPPALLRPGSLGRAAIAAALEGGGALGRPDAASPRASGTLAAHYAPRAVVTLLHGTELASRLASPHAASAESVGVYSRLVPPPGGRWVWRPMPGDAAAAAQELFAVLRRFDADGVSSLWVESPPEDPAWDGVRDRLQRAAAAGTAA